VVSCLALPLAYTSGFSDCCCSPRQQSSPSAYSTVRRGLLHSNCTSHDAMRRLQPAHVVQASAPTPLGSAPCDTTPSGTALATTSAPAQAALGHRRPTEAASREWSGETHAGHLFPALHPSLKSVGYSKFLIDIQNRTLGPCLAAIRRKLISVMYPAPRLKPRYVIERLQWPRKASGMLSRLRACLAFNYDPTRQTQKSQKKIAHL
jgi:hypothetical protein